MDRSPESFELIGSARSRLDEVERDRMDLKMEVAHLRSRLLERVGGDTSALELEEESFMLKKELVAKERMLADQAGYISGLELEHQKALMNLQKLDAAWRASALKTQQLQETLETTQKHSFNVEAMRKAIKAQDEAGRAMQDKLDALEAEVLDKDRAIEAANAQVAALTAQLDATKAELHAQAQANDAVHRAAALDLEAAKEKIAHFQGQATALRNNVELLEQANAALETTNGLLKAKVLQLTEENAATSVHVSTSKADYQRKLHEAASLQSDVDRLSADVHAKELQLRQAAQQAAVLEQLAQERLLLQQQLEVRVASLERVVETKTVALAAAEAKASSTEGTASAQMQAAESTIADLKQALEEAKQSRTLELQTARRVEQDLEKKWRDQVLTAEQRTRDAEASVAGRSKDLQRLTAWQSDVCELLSAASPAAAMLQVRSTLDRLAQLQRTTDALQAKLDAAETRTPITPAAMEPQKIEWPAKRSAAKSLVFEAAVTPKSPSLPVLKIATTPDFPSRLFRPARPAAAAVPPTASSSTPTTTTTKFAWALKARSPIAVPPAAQAKATPEAILEISEIKPSEPKGPTTTPTAAPTASLFRSFKSTPELPVRPTRPLPALVGLKRKGGDLTVPNFSKPRFTFGQTRPKAP
ncbi:hypothetical protein ACHHYP_00997 [Achlya hypogyna]|uniref:Uncharacterized protein n=1 Tax=Achlya hypogyna TaxID=1202772 RepID=A0A1V9Z9M8_ACHHY|nr:hypothetical protein ACHHYP_00997 [Achlya hypogyna]